jgi:hypothetical protein
VTFIDVVLSKNRSRQNPLANPDRPIFIDTTIRYVFLMDSINIHVEKYPAIFYSSGGYQPPFDQLTLSLSFIIWDYVDKKPLQFDDCKISIQVNDTILKNEWMYLFKELLGKITKQIRSNFPRKSAP